MRIRRVTDKSLLQRCLSTDRIEALYFLGDLDDYYFPKCEWYFVEDNGSPRSIILFYKSAGTTMLSLGDTAGVEYFLNEHHDLLPDRFYSAWYDKHDTAMRDALVIPDTKRMLRMSVTNETFKPCEYSDEIVSLDLSHTDQVRRLLESYPGNFFEEYQLATGYYRGILVDGKLVAMAGVHTTNVNAGVAAVGNVVTDREYRKRELACRVTSDVVAALLRRHDLVALNVERDNEQAVRVYTKLGFEARIAFREGFCQKRGQAADGIS